LTAAADLGDVECITDRTRWPAVFETVTGSVNDLSVINRIGPESVLLTKTAQGLGLAVTEDGWTGIYCMATHADHRRKGVATAVLAAAVRWSLDCGAPQLYLQVEEDNLPARALYEGLGFTQSHSYHYRVRP
jgi:GNAT superfamily N-acetyltransferase